MESFCTALFALGAAFFIAHSMDAVNKQEWRILGLSRLNESGARASFIIGHIILFVVLIYFVLTLSGAFLFIINILLIAHAIAHYFLRNSYENQFQSLFSNILIYSAAFTAIWHTVFWAIHLA